MVVFHGWMIPKLSSNKLAAWLFMQWTTSQDRRTKGATNSAGGETARAAGSESPAIRNRFLWNGGGRWRTDEPGPGPRSARE